MDGQDAAAGRKLFVGNLPWAVDSVALRSIFERFGQVQESFVLTDRETGRSRGFGFITFLDPESAQAAITAMDGKDFENRPLRVNLAAEKGEGGGGGGYRSGHGGGGGGYRGARAGGDYNSGGSNWRGNDGGNAASLQKRVFVSLSHIVVVVACYNVAFDDVELYYLSLFLRLSLD
ncbi:hypothetical protein SeMB42_g07866 [Synchytrium endobioticum]|uniref:RRM domain-containing protein n=1 Tax=Synchytrium endobioticum TaxID=286115 RepID=A0A507CRE9_9FUNG|nr:hypothetical protein SeMB42_g07866 [Synchytrium endobioticum]TPX41723.1 hypothetical protein SeLEV6574_g05947 [Synchytrium endobioticum]